MGTRLGATNVILKVTADVEAYITNMNKALSKFNQFTQQTRDLFHSLNRLSVAGLAASAGVAAGLGTIAKVGADVEFELDAVLAKTDELRVGGAAAAEQFERIKDTVLETARSSMFTPLQVARGASELAESGFSPDQQITTIPVAVDLATAAKVPIAMSASTLTDVLNAFKLGAQQARPIANEMAEVLTAVNMNFEQMRMSIRFAQTSAVMAGLDFKELAAFIGLVNDAGLKASVGGVSLGQLFLQLTIGADKLKKALADATARGDNPYEIMAEDLDINNVGAIQLIKNMKKVGFTTKELHKILNVRGLRAFESIDVDKLDALLSRLGGAQAGIGTAALIKELREENLVGKIGRLIGVMGELATRIYDSMAPALNIVLDQLIILATMAAEFVKQAPAVTAALVSITSGMTGLLAALSISGIILAATGQGLMRFVQILTGVASWAGTAALGVGELSTRIKALNQLKNAGFFATGANQAAIAASLFNQRGQPGERGFRPRNQTGLDIVKVVNAGAMANFFSDVGRYFWNAIVKVSDNTILAELKAKFATVIGRIRSFFVGVGGFVTGPVAAAIFAAVSLLPSVISVFIVAWGVVKGVATLLLRVLDLFVKFFGGLFGGFFKALFGDNAFARAADASERIQVAIESVGEMLPRLSRTLFKIGAMIGYAFGLIGKIVNALTGLGLQGIANVAEIIFQYIAGGADLVIATTNLLIVLVLKLFDLIIGSLETLLGKSFDFSEAKDFFKFVRDSILEGGKTLSDSAEKINTITDSIKFTSDAMKELNDNTDMATEAALKLREQMVGIRSAKDLSDSPLMGGIRKNLAELQREIADREKKLKDKNLSVIARDAIQRDLIEKKKLIESEIERIQILIKLTQELPEGKDRNNLIGELRNRLNTYEKIKRTVSEISDIEVDASQKAKDIAEGAAKDKFNTTMDAFSGDQLALEERAALLEQAIENFNSIFGGADKLRLALEYAKEAWNSLLATMLTSSSGFGEKFADRFIEGIKSKEQYMIDELTKVADRVVAGILKNNLLFKLLSSQPNNTSNLNFGALLNAGLPSTTSNNANNNQPDNRIINLTINTGADPTEVIDIIKDYIAKQPRRTF